MDGNAAEHLLDIPSTSRGLRAPLRRPEDLYRVPKPLGESKRFGSPEERYRQQRWHLERYVDVVEDPHHDRVVVQGLGYRDGLFGESPAPVEGAAVSQL
jgi:hypothetical protein